MAFISFHYSPLLFGWQLSGHSQGCIRILFLHKDIRLQNETNEEKRRHPAGSRPCESTQYRVTLNYGSSSASNIASALY